MRKTCFVWISLAASLGATAGAADGPAAFPVESNLRASVAKVDITPPEGTKVEGHPRVTHGKAVVRLNPDGPNDTRVKVLRFDDGRSMAPMAVLMHAVCHPCFFTWGDNVSPPYPNGYPKMSADFPGEAQRFVEKVYDGKTKALFLQGCAGDIRPNLPGYPYRCADEADIQWAGQDLGSAVVRAYSR